MYSKVGSFTAPASTGSQSTTGIGFQPKAVIFWYATSTASGWSYDIQNGVGFATVSGSGSVSGAALNNNVAHRYNHSATAIYNTDHNGTVTLSASLTSLDSSGFTLNWATTTSGDEVHYLALGGTDITGAMVKQWQAQGNTTNPQAVTGVGFTPDLVLHISSHNTNAPPASTTNYKRLDIGAMDSYGNQWAQSHDADSAGMTTYAGRYQLTNACIVTQTVYNANATQAAYTSMDNDGFTVTWSVDSTTPYLYSLCLKGGAYQVGNWSKSTSASSDTITVSHIATPTAVLITSNDIATTSGNTVNDRHMLGASDGANNRVAVMTEENLAKVAYRYWDTTHSIYVTNNDTETMQTAGTIGSFGTNTFTANYSTHDSVATEFCYVAFGTSITAVSTTVNVSEGKVRASKATAAVIETPVINLSEDESAFIVVGMQSRAVDVNASESTGVVPSDVGGNEWVATNVSESLVLTPTIDAAITGYTVLPPINVSECIGVTQAAATTIAPVINISESVVLTPILGYIQPINASESKGFDPTTTVAANVAPDIVTAEGVGIDAGAFEQYLTPVINVSEAEGVDPVEGDIDWVTAYVNPAINLAESLVIIPKEGYGPTPSINKSESRSIAPKTVEPPEGTGKLWFGGVDITTAPYFAGLAYETKYWFLDGFDSMQFVTSPLSLVSTRPYLKDWLISTVIRVVAPDKRRSTLLSSLIALSELFDPRNGEQQLIFYEYPGSYFMAKRQTSTLANETASPFVAEIDIDWACTGPAYSRTEQTVQKTILGMTTDFTVTSYGDSQAYPVWRIYVGLGGKNRFRFTNKTTGESVVWGMANVAFGDVLEFIMDPEYGTPYTVLQNGNPSLTTVSGPSWPHLVPGENVIEIRQSYPAPEIVEVEWRDRFIVGQQVAPIYPIRPAVEMPTYVTISGKDTPGKPGSYIFSGHVEDVFFNAVPNAKVTLYVSTPVKGVDVAWSIATTPVLTDANGNYTFNPTGVVTDKYPKHFRTYFGGDKTHISAYSSTIAATPPQFRTATNCDLKQTGTDPYYEFYGALDSTTGYVAGVPMVLQISVPASGTDHYQNYWRNAPTNFTTDKTVAITDKNGNFGFFYTPGPGIEYFRAYHPADLNYLESYSTAPPTASLTVTENVQWPTQEPGPIDYWVCMPKAMLDAGRLQYFAALGFTKCVLSATYNDITDVYTDELAIIKALGMTPLIDIEFVVDAGKWNEGNFSVYTEWLQNLAAAGWTTVTSEAGWPGCIEFVYSCGLTGYVNYGIDKGPLTFTWKDPITGVITTVEGIYINQGTTANSWECYYDSQIGLPGQNEVKGGINASTLLGIQNGIIMGVWNHEIYNNSIMNTTPNSLGTGNTYESIFAWSYDNGTGLDFLNVFFYPMNPKMCMNYFFNLDMVSLITRLQIDYPPAHTDQLIAPTTSATYATMDWVKNTDGTYSFSGTLSELFSANPMIGEGVTLQVSPNEYGGPFTDMTITSAEGANPAITDGNGFYSWSNIPLTLNTKYYFRVYYAGDATHMPTYGPYDDGNEGLGIDTGTGAIEETLVPSQGYDFTR